jgi:anti-anti-sigma factor
MTAPAHPFEIQESTVDGCVRLSVTGELDLLSAPVLEDRLSRFRAFKSPVRLDLSKLEFIDSTGLHMLVRTVGEARIKKWPLQIEPNVSPQVRSAFRLAQLDRFIEADGRQARRR